MRIGLVYHQFVPRGGLEGYLFEFSSRLKEQGHQLEVVTAEMDSSMEKKLEATVHRVPVVKGSSLLRMWQFERAASQKVGQLHVDVTIGFGRTTTHDLHRAGGGCHAVYSELLSPLKRYSLKNQLELSLEKQLYTEGKTKRFVVNSNEVAKQLHERYGTPQEQFRTIHTAVDCQKFHPSLDRAALKQKICSKLGADPSRPAFLFVSLNHRRKGLDVLLEIWREVDADLWIVGKELSSSYRSKIRALGLQNKVRTIARQSDVTLLYQAADWFVHPTLYDACANTVLQSMACGLPGLISIKDGAIDLIEDHGNGWLLKAPQEEQAVLGQVKHALDTPESTRAQMAQVARDTVLPLTWEAHVQKWLRLIDDIS